MIAAGPIASLFLRAMDTRNDDDCQRDHQRATEALRKASDAGLAKLTLDQLAMLDR